MLKKLKAALKKIGRRITARESEAKRAGKKARILTQEIEKLRTQLHALHERHAETLCKLRAEEEKPRPDSKTVKRLREIADTQSDEIRVLAKKLKFKVGKRSSWRTRRRKAQKRAAWWLRRRTTVRKRYKKAKEKWEAEHKLDFQPWMLNGCPGNIDEDLKKVVVFQVVACGQYVTSTTGGTHSSGSYHYPWNNPDNKGHAVDTGATSVSSMREAAEKTRKHFGENHFLELFSPCGWYIKHGVVFSGFFPAHGDHGHYAVA